VATSREVLRIDGESVYRVPPLEVPAPGQAAPDYIMQYSAVELFVARTKALNGGFSPHAEDLASIATICRHLDGIPLAIELAAASAAALGIEQVSAGLRDRFALLTRGRRTALPRQRTLRATLDWSHELLPETERRLLRRLAVFAGGFTVDSAAAVMADAGLDAAMVADCIANLVTKSLIALDPTPGVTRWTLLETIRAYALEKLVETPRPTSPRNIMHCIFAISSHRRREAPDRLYRMRTWRAVFERSTTFARRSTGPSPRPETRRLASTSQPPIRRSGDTYR
jgi:predicted ATPase